MANPDVEPWAPDPATPPGTPPGGPANGGVGERGTSAFPGNVNFNPDTTRLNGFMGPLRGVDYHQTEAPQAIVTVTAGGREAAGSHVPDSVTVTASAASTTPAADAADALTATVTSPARYPITGTVQFKDGGTNVGAPVDVTNGTATLPNADGFAAGAHTITAVYSGDDNYSTSTSNTVTVTAS